MTVAYELRKTLDEVKEMQPNELADWLAFFKLREKRLAQERAKRKRGR